MSTYGKAKEFAVRWIAGEYRGQRLSVAVAAAGLKLVSVQNQITRLLRPPKKP